MKCFILLHFTVFLKMEDDPRHQILQREVIVFVSKAFNHFKQDS